MLVKGSEENGFTVWFNLRNGMADCVAEMLTSDVVVGEASRSFSQFVLDPDMIERFPHYEPVSFDSWVAGFARGHLAAACNHKCSQEAMDRTFQFPSNVVPQDWYLNGGDWHRLERFVINLVWGKPGKVYVVSGPVWIGKDGKIKTKMVGENLNIPVPTHIFKVVKFHEESGQVFNAAFLFENCPCLVEQPLQDFKVDLSYLETVTGLDLTGMRADNDMFTSPLFQDSFDAAVDSFSMQKLRLQARVAVAEDVDELRSIVTDAAQAKLFGDHQLDLVDDVRSRAESFNPAVTSKLENLINFLFPPVTDRYDPQYYGVRNFARKAFQALDANGQPPKKRKPF